MGEAPPRRRMTAQEYLAWEAEQTERHDFVHGEVYAMAGAEDRHVTASGNVYVCLRQHLSGSPCRAYMADMKVQAHEGDHFFYPDVVVTCSEADRARPLVKREPLLLVEVLSPSTAAYDMGEKFAQYRAMPSVQEIVFIELDQRRANVYRRGPDGLWVLHPFEREAGVHLQSVGLTISAQALFAEVDDDAGATGAMVAAGSSATPNP